MRFKIVGPRPKPVEPKAPTLRAAAEDVAQSVKEQLPGVVAVHAEAIRTEMVQTHNDSLAETESHLNGFHDRLSALEKRPTAPVAAPAPKVPPSPESFVGEGAGAAATHPPATEPQPPQFEFKNGEMRLRQPDGKWGPWFKLGAGGGGLTQDQIIQLILQFGSSSSNKCVAVAALPFTESVAVGNYYFVSVAGTFSLEAAPADTRIVTVKRMGAGPLVIDGNGHTIDGNAQVSITQQYTSLTFFYCTSVGQWSIV